MKMRFNSSRMNLFPCRVYHFFIAILLFFIGSNCGIAQNAYISYLYPAGGRQGTQLELLLGGGGGIGRANAVFVSGEGVQMKIIARSTHGDFLFQTPMGQKSKIMITDMIKDELSLLAENLSPKEIKKRRETMREKRLQSYQKRSATEKKAGKDIPFPSYEEVFSSFPYLHRLEKPTLTDLQLIYGEYFAFRFDRRIDRPFRETLTIEADIAPDAVPGLRDVFFMTPQGLSRAAQFWVSNYPEVREIEPNETPIWEPWKKMSSQEVSLPPQQLPVVLNGQIRPGDIDRFYFYAQKGKKIVFDVQARTLKPFIADAVPGWFAAVIAVYDKEGKQLKFADSWRFDQNPLLVFEPEKNGIYRVDLQDSIFRGRSDFVYRLTIGEMPLVCSIEPLGGEKDKPLEIVLSGENLPINSMVVDSSAPDSVYEEIRTVKKINDLILSRPFYYFVETLPIFDNKPENKSQPVDIELPIVIYGGIEQQNEVDSYRFHGKKGESIVFDVTAQRIGSALDAVLELIGPTGETVAFNDDRTNSREENIGIDPHQTDPFILYSLLEEGEYQLRLYSRTRREGPDYFYRLRISPPQGDFTVISENSVVRRNGQKAEIKLRIFRREQFEGPLTIQLKNPNDNIVLSNNIIKPDEETKTVSIRLTTTPQQQPMNIDLVAVGEVNGRKIEHQVIATDDWEQAFSYHHRVPATHLILDDREQKNRLKELMKKIK